MGRNKKADILVRGKGGGKPEQLPQSITKLSVRNLRSFSSMQGWGSLRALKKKEILQFLSNHQAADGTLFISFAIYLITLLLQSSILAC